MFCANFEGPANPQMSINATIFFDVVDLQTDNWFDLRTSTFRPPENGETFVMVMAVPNGAVVTSSSYGAGDLGLNPVDN